MATKRAFTLDQLVTDPNAEAISERVVITPEVAREILDKHNKANRRVRPYRIANYASDMVAGQWKYNGDPIRFDWDGEMFDGQHRLHACIEAGVPFETQIVYNLEPETKQTVDDGIPRSLADKLAWENYTDTGMLAAATSAWYRWLSGAPDAPRGKRPTVAVALALLDANPGLVLAANQRHKVRTLGIPTGAFIPFLHAIRLIDYDRAEEFLAGLSSGANLSPTSPIYVARRWFENRRIVTNSKVHIDATVYAAILIKAWNAWLADKSLNTIVFRNTGPARERFPQLMTPAGKAWEPRNERTDVVIPQGIDPMAQLRTINTKGQFLDATDDEPAPTTVTVPATTMQAMAEVTVDPGVDRDSVDALRSALEAMAEADA